MLAPIKQLLVQNRIVLASGSPRRQEIIKLVGINAELCPSKFEENLIPRDFENFESYIEATALGKAEEVFTRLTQEQNSDSTNMLIIAADTLVTVENEVYGKPKNADDAVRMLTNLSGKCHRVYTGVALKYARGVRQFTEFTDVYFGNLTAAQIQAYVDTGDPLDKAGAYGIQGMGGSLINKIHGDYYCVMGLPLHRLCAELNKIYLR